MSGLMPPKDDEILSRQQFYTITSIFINNIMKDINGIGAKSRKYEEEFNVIRDSVRADDIRNKTIIAVAVVIWTITGGAISLYIQKAINSYEQTALKIDSLEKKVLVLESNKDQFKELPTQIEALKRTINETQRQIESIENRNITSAPPGGRK